MGVFPFVRNVFCVSFLLIDILPLYYLCILSNRMVSFISVPSNLYLWIVLAVYLGCAFYSVPSNCFFLIIWLSNLSTLSVPDEGYSRNESCALILISINVFISTTFVSFLLFSLYCTFCSVRSNWLFIFVSLVLFRPSRMYFCTDPSNYYFIFLSLVLFCLIDIFLLCHVCILSIWDVPFILFLLIVILLLPLCHLCRLLCSVCFLYFSLQLVL